VSILLLSWLVIRTQLQQQGIILLQHPCSTTAAAKLTLRLFGTTPVGQNNRIHATAGAPTSSSSSKWQPSSMGSCSQHTTSSFPYIGHDVFLDFAHQTFAPGSDLTLRGPSIVFMHPQDAPAFAAYVPKLQHNVVLVSNSNVDQCLPWAHGDNVDSWRPHVDAILNSSRVVSW
jgi:hypothetical protein